MAAIGKIKKGDTVILCAFTGMQLGVKEVVDVDKSTITINTDKGEITFDRKTLKQIDPEPKAARFANTIKEDDGSFVPPQRGKKKKATKKPVTKKAKPEPEEDVDEEDETPAPKKAAKKKPAPKKKPEPQPVEEDEDDDEDEEWDDDDFEEVE